MSYIFSKYRCSLKQLTVLSSRSVIRIVPLYATIYEYMTCFSVFSILHGWVSSANASRIKKTQRFIIYSHHLCEKPLIERVLVKQA